MAAMKAQFKIRAVSGTTDTLVPDTGTTNEMGITQIVVAMGARYTPMFGAAERYVEMTLVEM